MHTIKIIFAFGISSFLFLMGATALAQNDTPESAFQSYADITISNIKVPTVVEVPFLRSDFRFSETFLVRDNQNSGYIPSFYRASQAVVSWSASVYRTPSAGDPYSLVDGDYSSFVEFGLPAEGEGDVEIVMLASAPQKVSGFTLVLDNATPLPTLLSITLLRDDGSRYDIVRRIRPTSAHVSFPETVGNRWLISLNYAQPLRLREIRPEYDGGASDIGNLRLLAVPGHSYRLYFDGDQDFKGILPESGNLQVNEGVLVLPRAVKQSNPLYRPADSDADGVLDLSDNCTQVPNADQEDVDGNSRGDACEDFDRDSIVSAEDNCPNDPNAAQTDIDADGIGDACDEEESRFTEAHKWVPWAGMGTAALVLLVLVVLMVRSGGFPNNDTHVREENNHV